MDFPRIQIKQQFAQLGIQTQAPSLQIRQPRPTFELSTTKPQLEIHSPRGELVIDQSKAWAALGVGDHLKMMDHIYSEAHRVVLEEIGRIAENGDKLADIAHGGNPIAEIARQDVINFLEFNYTTPASYDNVDIYYTAHKPEFNVQNGTVQLQSHPNMPEYQYTRGKVSYQMLQYAKLEIIPPQIDAKI